MIFRMSRAAAEILQTFYLRLRDRNSSADGTPITARQLESLVRLAEARARLDLREEVSAEDAKVINFFAIGSFLIMLHDALCRPSSCSMCTHCAETMTKHTIVVHFSSVGKILLFYIVQMIFDNVCRMLLR